MIGDVSHCSLFGECRPGAIELAAAEKVRDPICSDREGLPRPDGCSEYDRPFPQTIPSGAQPAQSCVEINAARTRWEQDTGYATSIGGKRLF